jgi:acetoin utilization protein AcuB
MTKVRCRVVYYTVFCPKLNLMNIDAPITSIMTAEVRSIEPDQLLVDLKRIYENLDFHSHVPVLENGKLVGIVSLINFMHAIGGAGLDDTESVYQTRKVREIMTSNPVTLAPNATIRDAAHLLADGQFHSVLIAESGDLKGIITTTDIINALLD